MCFSKVVVCLDIFPVVSILSCVLIPYWYRPWLGKYIVWYRPNNNNNSKWYLTVMLLSTAATQFDRQGRQKRFFEVLKNAPKRLSDKINRRKKIWIMMKNIFHCLYNFFYWRYIVWNWDSTAHIILQVYTTRGWTSATPITDCVWVHIEMD